MTIQLSINLLGPFEAVAPGGQRLVVSSRRARALLACLAMETRESWTRSRLATLLWHSRPEQQGRSSLRQELVQLRKNLGQTAAADWGNQDFLVLPRQITTDIAGFRAALSVGDAIRATALWRGELLQDTPAIYGAFPEWLALSRAKLRKQAAECLERALRAAGDPTLSQLEPAARRLAALDPGNETACRSLMRCAALRRDLAGVIACYQAYAADAGQVPSAAASEMMKRHLDEMIEAASHQERALPSRLSSG
jgi:DNA-binding SARP family transcriptional activator